jgi:hypothetical protein
MRNVILATVMLVLGVGTWALAGASCCSGGGCASCPQNAMAAAATQPSTRPAGATYVCPMGCAKSDKPGKCPKCGMDLVKQAQP